MRFCLLVLCISGLAWAEPARLPQPVRTDQEPGSDVVVISRAREDADMVELSAPAPLLMPELVPRTRLIISPMASTGLVINLLQVGVGGTLAIGNFEVFGDVRVRLAAVLFDRGDTGGGLALGNVRAGARYHLPRPETCGLRRPSGPGCQPPILRARTMTNTRR
ncbi:MAG: hypothetical protein H0T42_11315 [Deltaproteobacteria bacterium]|nr:hypothetical protein [Deltaproteobacteria bacterium]